jgi:hypothetical protein
MNLTFHPNVLASLLDAAAVVLGFRGYRDAQPPATVSHPSGMRLSRLVNPKGWEKVAGGRSNAETSGKRLIGSQHPEGVPEH